MLNGSVKPLSETPFNQNSIVENSIDKNRVVVEEEKEEKNAATADKVMVFYLNNINQTPTPHEAEVIEKYQKELPDDLIIYAMEQAVENKARKISYISAILDRYIQNDITTLAEAKEKKKPKEEKTDNRYRNTNEIDYEQFYANFEED